MEILPLYAGDVRWGNDLLKVDGISNELLICNEPNNDGIAEFIHSAM